MAIDTAEKRASMLSFGGPGDLLPVPTGAFEEGDRKHLVDLYAFGESESSEVTYDEGATGYAYGDEGGSFTNPTSFMELGPSGYVAWCRFTGLTEYLEDATGTVSATLTVSGFTAPMTAETIRVYGESAQDSTLPTDGTDSASRDRTSATTTTGSLEGLTTIDIDVEAIVEELRGGIDGDVIQFVLDDPSYAGTGLSNMLATLEIVYTMPGGGGGGAAAVAASYYYHCAMAANRMGDLPSV